MVARRKEIPSTCRLLRGSAPAGRWACPDLVVKMKDAYKVPARGVVPQVTLPTDYEFPEDTWIQAIEIRPGSRRVVHQALAVVGTSGLATSLHLYAPGLPATIYREGYGRFLAKGTRIYLRLHYNAIGVEVTDQSEVAFKFATKPVHTEVRTGIADANPPAATPLDSHQSLTTFPLAVDARIHAFRPHMAIRGDSATATLVLPDRTRRTLVSVAGWTDNWEYSYILTKPVDVPQGSAVDYATSRPVDPSAGKSTHLLLFDWTPVTAANKDDAELDPDARESSFHNGSQGSVAVRRSPAFRVRVWTAPAGQRISTAAVSADPRVTRWLLLFCA